MLRRGGLAITPRLPGQALIAPLHLLLLIPLLLIGAESLTPIIVIFAVVLFSIHIRSERPLKRKRSD
jgi:hypothetical protein